MSLKGFRSVKFAVMVESFFEILFLWFFFSLLVVSILSTSSWHDFFSVSENFNFGRINNLSNSISVFVSTTTWVAWFFNRNIFIMINRNVINNWFRVSDWLFISYLIRNNSSGNSLGSAGLGWFNDFFISSFNCWGLLELNLNSFLVNCWSGDILFVVSVSWNIDSLRSRSGLVDWFSGDWISVNDLILSLSPINF